MNEGIDIDVDSLMDVPVSTPPPRPASAPWRTRATASCPPRTSSPCSRQSSTRIPGPSYDENMPLQAHVTNLDASPFLGRLALLLSTTAPSRR